MDLENFKISHLKQRIYHRWNPRGSDYYAPLSKEALNYAYDLALITYHKGKSISYEEIYLGILIREVYGL